MLASGVDFDPGVVLIEWNDGNIFDGDGAGNGL